MLHAVFGNASFYHPFTGLRNDIQTEHCGYSLFPVIYYMLIGKHDYFHFYFHQNALRFVSCGRVQQKLLEMPAFTYMFDKYLWLRIILCLAILSLFTKFTSGVLIRTEPDQKAYIIETIGATVFSCWSVLLEQGNPFFDSVWKAQLSLSVVYLPVLLGMMVISNGCKKKPKGIDPLKFIYVYLIGNEFIKKAIWFKLRAF